MEQMNFVQIRGRVGNTRIFPVGDRKVNHFSVATTCLYKDKDNQAVEDTTWFSCNLWSSKRTPSVDVIKVGMPIEIKGRIKTNRYNATDGTERTSFEVAVSEFTILPENEILRAENCI